MSPIDIVPRQNSADGPPPTRLDDAKIPICYITVTHREPIPIQYERFFPVSVVSARLNLLFRSVLCAWTPLSRFCPPRTTTFSPAN